MSVVQRSVAACIALLLLGAPAAFACGELGSGAAHCSMPEMSASMAMAPCHQDDQMSRDCCDMGSSPDPIRPPAVEGSKLLLVSEALDLTAANLVPPTDEKVGPARDVGGLAFLQRYTLFSAYLL